MNIPNINRLFFYGTISRDFTVKPVGNGNAVANLPLVNIKTFIGKDGTEKQVKFFIDATIWGKSAEACSNLSVGDGVYIEGSLGTESWTNKDGVKQYKTKIDADKIQFLGSKAAASPDVVLAKPAASSAGTAAPATPVDDDDIPF